jgi:hypothetical protein
MVGDIWLAILAACSTEARLALQNRAAAWASRHAKLSGEGIVGTLLTLSTGADDRRSAFLLGGRMGHGWAIAAQGATVTRSPTARWWKAFSAAA